MNITKEWLEAQGACSEGKTWFLSQSKFLLKDVISSLIKHSLFDWANWTITKAMSHKQNVKYACYSAKQNLKNFEKVYLKDKRPRLAIEAALKWVKEPTEENRSAAESARSAAESAAWSAAWKKILEYGLKLCA